MNNSKNVVQIINTMSILIDKWLLTFSTNKQKNSFKQRLTSLATEGEILSDKEIIDLKKRIDGEQTDEEFLQNIKAGYYE